MILVKSNINKSLIIIIIRKFSLSSASPETEMINLKIYAGWNKVNKVIMNTSSPVSQVSESFLCKLYFNSPITVLDYE